ncbi:MAG: formylglycine-generating enzyme family protein [Anaerolineae bacterium]|nr:formylglycine-generating enzyme family protein [Anaerolineae bacterium]
MPTPTPTLPMTLAVTTARTGTPETITIGPPNTSTMTPAVSVTSSPRPTTPIPPRDMIAFASGIYSLLTIDNQTRLVQIDAFAIDPHEVTRADFRPFAENPANSTPATRERLLQTVMNNNDLPVVNVTYDEARAYCQLIGKDLPTADQWTLAAGWNPSEARINRYAWGLDEINTNYTNMDNRLGRVISVMTLPPNAAGLYEMGGNAAEWVLSEAVDDYRAYGGDYLAPYSSGHVAHFDRYDRPDPALEMARIGFRCVQNS